MSCGGGISMVVALAWWCTGQRGLAVPMAPAASPERHPAGSTASAMPACADL